MNTPWKAAKDGIGVGQLALITRHQHDARRCGLATGPGPAWKWAYRVIGPGGVPSGTIDRLDEAREHAATLAEFVREAWPGGRNFKRGPLGGLRRIDATTTTEGKTKP